MRKVPTKNGNRLVKGKKILPGIAQDACYIYMTTTTRSFSLQ